MKKYLSLLLAVAMLIPALCVPFTASAAEVEIEPVSVSFESDGLVYPSAGSWVDVDKNALKTVRDNIHNHESDFSVTVETTEWKGGDDVKAYLNAYSETLLNKALEHTGDPVEGDYVKYQLDSWKWNVSLSGRNKVYIMTFNFSLNYYTTKQQERQLDQKVDQIIASLDIDNKNNYQRICAVYDYITSHVKYDDAATRREGNGDLSNKIPHSAYGALCNGTAVCQGYSIALYRLLLSAGIDSRIIIGKGIGFDHAWNIARLNSKYYYLDSTWDSQRTKNEFFLCSEANFKDHVAANEFKNNDFRSKYPLAASSYSPTADAYKGVPIIGDIDSDGDITSADSLRILRISVSLEKIGNTEFKLADVNGDSSVDSSDALEILRYSVGLKGTSNLIGTRVK